ncbi:hypothetical protein JD844_014001 [Phrynosoma platyrhinos]|uniref:Vps52 C-terminal domain-containing protein n=1 Tax=Phrynosoma platyrhinos TaxID=52577 RepID=A0ABQ7TMD4_PHRPL|nr:hypothetical protein JD844_014001 [Phrynosoma platyrhinos]
MNSSEGINEYNHNNTPNADRFFYQFLVGQERSVAKEVRDEYVETMSKIYLSYFKSYTSRLMKVQIFPALVVLDSAWRPRFFSKPSLRNRNTIFTLGNRGNVIGSAELEGPIIVPHSAQKSDVRYPFESLFRSQHYALLDNSCREYLFLCDFFLVTGTPALDLFHTVMGKTLAMFLVSRGCRKEGEGVGAGGLGRFCLAKGPVSPHTAHDGGGWLLPRVQAGWASSPQREIWGTGFSMQTWGASPQSYSPIA